MNIDLTPKGATVTEITNNYIETLSQYPFHSILHNGAGDVMALYRDVFIHILVTPKVVEVNIDSITMHWKIEQG